MPVHFLRTFHPYRHFTFYALDDWRMSRFVRRLGPDVIHAHGTEAAYGHAAVRSGLPFCVTAQGLFFQIIPTLGRPPTWGERFLALGETMVWNRTKWAIAKSPYGAKGLRDRFPHLEVELIYNTYDPIFDKPLAEKNGPLAVFVGTIDRRKGFHLLPRVFSDVVARCPETILHVVGNAPEGLGSNYEQTHVRALRRILGSRLVLHGKLPVEGVVSVLDRCRLIVAPSLEEMSGNQVTEGLLRGCHAVVFEETGVAGIVSQVGNCSIVPFADASAFARAVVSNLSAPFDLARAESSRKAVQDLMSRTGVALRHANWYRRILEARGTP